MVNFIKELMTSDEPDSIEESVLKCEKSRNKNVLLIVSTKLKIGKTSAFLTKSCTLRPTLVQFVNPSE